MCLAAAPLAAMANIASVLGTVVGVVGTMQQTKAQSNMYEYQAKVNEINAGVARNQAKDASERGFEAEQELRRKAGAAHSAQKSALAAQGTEIASGNPLDIMTDTTFQKEQDAAVIRYNAQLEKYGYLAQGQDYANQANMDRVAADNTRIAGRWNMASSLLTGASTVGNQFAQYQRNYPNRGLFKIGR